MSKTSESQINEFIAQGYGVTKNTENDKVLNRFHSWCIRHDHPYNVVTLARTKATVWLDYQKRLFPIGENREQFRQLLKRFGYCFPPEAYMDVWVEGMPINDAIAFCAAAGPLMKQAILDARHVKARAPV